jgi:opine dehydrogenase
MKITILGGGNGAYAAAADLSEKGHEVTLWRRSRERFSTLLDTKTILLEDIQGTRPVRIKNVTTDPKAAVQGAECIVIPLPATAQRDVAEPVAPCLETGQVVYLPPGTFGTYLFLKEMKACGNTAQVSFAETGTLPYLARKHGEDRVTISVRATRLPTGVYPSRTTGPALQKLSRVYPAIEPLKDVLDGALMNAGPIIHPPLILMNAGPLEHFDVWDIHNEGTQPSIRRVTNALDRERIRLRQALGYGAPHFPLADHYDDNRDEWMYGNSSHERLTGSGNWREHIDLTTHRYMREDVATGLVFYATLGDWAGVQMPVSKGLIAVASAVVGEDLMAGPRSWKALGLSNLSAQQLSDFLENGFILPVNEA